VVGEKISGTSVFFSAISFFPPKYMAFVYFAKFTAMGYMIGIAAGLMLSSKRRGIWPVAKIRVYLDNCSYNRPFEEKDG